MFNNKTFRELVLWPTYILICLIRPMLPFDHPWSFYNMGKFYTYERWCESATDITVAFGFIFCVQLVLLIAL